MFTKIILPYSIRLSFNAAVQGHSDKIRRIPHINPRSCQISTIFVVTYMPGGFVSLFVLDSIIIIIRSEARQAQNFLLLTKMQKVIVIIITQAAYRETWNNLQRAFHTVYCEYNSLNC
jgi:hypothetical protein